MAATLWDVARLSDERTRSIGRRCRDVVLVIAVALVALAVSRIPVAPHWVSPQQVAVLLAIAAGAVSVAIAVVWTIIRRLTADGRASWVSAGFAVYGLIGVPATMLGAVVGSAGAYAGAVRLAAHAVVAVMLLVSTLGAVQHLSVRCPVLFAAGTAVALGAGAFAAVDPRLALAVTGYTPVRYAVVAGWLVAGIAVAGRGLALGLSPTFRSGLGLVVLAGAHGYRVGTGAAAQFSVPDQVFSCLRLTALLIVLLGTVQFAVRSLRGIGAEREQRDLELRAAEEGLARLAERDHELRNGIAGLAGATGLLRGSLDEAEEAALTAAVAAELSRLDVLLVLRPRQRRPRATSPRSRFSTCGPPCGTWPRWAAAAAWTSGAMCRPGCWFGGRRRC